MIKKGLIFTYLTVFCYSTDFAYVELPDMYNDSSTFPLSWVREYVPEHYIKPSFDYAKAIAMDICGNVYVTGNSKVVDGYDDIVTIKYNTYGEKEWIVRYDGIGRNIDQAKGIIVDSECNIYVCGLSYNNRSNFDFVIIKYNSNGVKEWDSYFNGPFNDYDEPTGIKLDNKGNVYITGISNSKFTSYDWVTVKYNKYGVLQWAIIYDGPKNSFDYPTALAVDDNGNVFVTGFSTGLQSGYDYTTIKYNTNGKEIWVSRYNGIANGNDFANSIALDQNGGIYVTGMSEMPLGNYDYLTIKLDAYGNILWNTTYNGIGNDNDEATNIMIDGLSRIIVTGRSKDANGFYDIVTAVYDTNGNELWVSQYDGAGYNDEPVAITFDRYNNTIITGLSISPLTSIDIMTVKYDRSGSQMWVNIFNGIDNNIDEPAGILVDYEGNVYVTGYSIDKLTFADYILLKYSSAGQLEWEIIQDILGGGSGFVSDFVLDNYGNIYVTGKSYNIKKNSYDYITIKYDSFGNLLWFSKYQLANDTTLLKTSMDIDSSFNIYIAGVCISETSGIDYLILKYNKDGELEWVNTYNGNANGDDIITDIKTDCSGNVYVTGYSYNNSNNFDYTTLKYNNRGDLLWNRVLNGIGSSEDIPVTLKVDNCRNVFVVGKSKNTDGFNDILTVKYTSDGEIQWVVRYNSPANKDDVPTGASIDHNGYLYIAGYTYTEAGNHDYITIKYSVFGIPLWIKRYNGTANSGDYPSDITTDSFGNVYITGKSAGLNTSYDYLTIKYNQYGEEQWIARYNDVSNQYDEAKSLAVDKFGNVYVTGVSLIKNTLKNVSVVYNKFGHIVGKATYADPQSSEIKPIKIMVDSFNDFIICLNIYLFEFKKFATIKFKNTKTNVLPSYSNNDTVSIFIYPNPFNEKVSIVYNIPYISMVEIKIYNLNGQLVKEFKNDFMQSGNYKIVWDGTDRNNQIVSSGVYILYAKIGSYIKTKKVLFIK